MAAGKIKQRVTAQNGLDKLEFTTADMPTPQEGEVLVNVTAVSLNYKDTKDTSPANPNAITAASPPPASSPSQTSLQQRNQLPPHRRRDSIGMAQNATRPPRPPNPAPTVLIQGHRRRRPRRPANPATPPTILTSSSSSSASPRPHTITYRAGGRRCCGHKGGRHGGAGGDAAEVVRLRRFWGGVDRLVLDT